MTSRESPCGLLSSRKRAEGAACGGSSSPAWPCGASALAADVSLLTKLTPEQLAAMRRDVQAIAPNADPSALVEKLEAKHGRFTSPLLERIQPTLSEPLATTVSTLISIMTGHVEGQALE